MNSLVCRTFNGTGLKFLRKRDVRRFLIPKAGDQRSNATCSAPPPPSTDTCCPQPPSCPEPPPCPPRLCPQNPDPANPCNYCPPPCRDGPDLTRLKKNQCFFQEDDTSIFLYRGNRDAMVYQGILFLTFFSFFFGLYSVASHQS